VNATRRKRECLHITNRHRTDHNLRFENLIQRYEEPSSMVRWDSPLFTLPWDEDRMPMEDIWQAITAGVLKPPNAGTTAVS
jgi:tRNA uridine 5-carbamoylmethylation protein Kti12